MVTRRMTVGGLLASLIAPGCTPAGDPGAPPAQSDWTRVIDAHCHVFNVDDLPVHAFLSRVALPERCLTHLSAVSWLVAIVLKALAPGVAAERRALESGTSLANAVPPPVASMERRIEALTSGLRDLRDIAEGATLRSRIARSAVDQKAAPSRDDAAAFLRSLQPALPIPGVRRRGRFGFASDAELRAIAESLVDRNRRGLPTFALGLSGRDVARVLEWGFKLAHYRFQLVEELAAISGIGRRPVLLTPALIDFGPWIGADVEPPAASFDAQIDLMELIARRRPGGAFVHPFAPYDPWRAAADLAAGRRNGPLGLVEEAIRSRGAMGVKLYPPMGFQAWNNQNVAATTFDPALVDATAGRPGYFLDRALAALYDTCTMLDAPLMAHCADSNQATPEAGLRADPKHWASAVARFPGLRVSLGHIGGIWLLDAPEKRCDLTPKADWTGAAADLIAGRSDQVWGDLSFFAELLGGGAPYDEAVDALRLFAQHRARPNMIYGSDWIMVGQVEGADTYADRIAAATDKAGIPSEQFAWRAAARFLGLDRDGEQRRRLLAFHRDDPAALAGIKKFMPGLS